MKTWSCCLSSLVLQQYCHRTKGSIPFLTYKDLKLASYIPSVVNKLWSLVDNWYTFWKKFFFNRYPQKLFVLDYWRTGPNKLVVIAIFDYVQSVASSHVIGASRPLTGSPMGLPTFFFFLLLPPPKMAFPEAKRNEGNLVLTWYFRKSFL